MKGVCICLVYLYYLTGKCVLAAAPLFIVPSSGVVVTNSVAESIAPGSSVLTLVAQDLDADLLTFSIKSQTPNSPAFVYDAATGEIGVPAGGLDAETSQNFVFVFSVSDSTTTVDSEPFTLTVTDVNEYPPVCSYAGSATDGDPTGTLILTVTATDRDVTDTVTYSITDGNAPDTFIINGATGEITIGNATNVDSLTTPSYNLIVMAADSSGNSATVQAVITVNADACDPNPCQNSGTCVTSADSFICTCTPGYSGTNCTTVDRCVLNPCQNSGTCENFADSYICICAAGWLGINCTTEDLCYGNPCENSGTCSRTGTDYLCTCTSGYIGTNCETVDLCYVNPCNNSGTCSQTGSDYLCTCTSGYIGTNCETEDLCYVNPCENLGTCSQTESDYLCTCKSGYIGTNCDTVDLCSANPCENAGTCSQTNSSYSCTCTGGYIGTNCETANLCYDNPCENSGTCSQTGSGHACTCSSGYIGTNCGIVDRCVLNPCQNSGTCENSADSYTCICAAGWLGINCTTEDLCYGNPCENSGTCSRTGTDYLCTCTSGYIGTNCETVDLCYVNPCKNSGTCSQTGSDYLCTCTSGYIGTNCETENQCYANPCENSGTCSQTVSDYLCTCKSGYSGTNCDTVYYSCSCSTGFASCTSTTVDRCVLNPCQNSGTCENSADSYTCICAAGWLGINCTTEDLCHGNPCENSGTCSRTGTDYLCTCTSGYIGNICETVDLCYVNPCKNSGTCSQTDSDYLCSCTSGYIGTNCETDDLCYVNPCENTGTCSRTESDYLCSCTSGYIGTNCDTKTAVACPTQNLYSKEHNATVTIPVTNVGEVAYSWERCFKETGALASVKCEDGKDDGAYWGNISYTTGCIKLPEHHESISTDALRNLSQINITTENVDTIFEDIANLTLPQLNLTEADIIYIAQIFYNYMQSPGKSAIPLSDIFDVINNVIQAAPYALSQAQEINSAANRMLRAVDDLTNIFKLSTPTTQTFIRDYVAGVVIYQTGESDIVIGIELEKTDSTKITDKSLSLVENSTDISQEQTDTAIYISANVLTGAVTRLSFHIYSKTELFSTPQGRYSLNSKVAAVRLERNGQPIIDLGDDRVTVVFKVFQVSDDVVCGYWDYSDIENAGGWKTDGCVQTKNENGSKITCECNHLTNFAVLIDVKADIISDTHKDILDIVTKVGLGISIIALSLILITFLVFKHLRKGRGQQVLVNLSVAMLCSTVIFLVGMDRAETKTGCKVVAVLLHYFILVSFAWMLVEGVLQYLRFVKVLGTYIPNFMKKSMIPAWGIPLIPVIVVLAIDHELYYGGKGYCWLETKAMLYAFIIPVAMVIFANLVVFVLVLCNICRRRNKSSKSNQLERKLVFLRVQAGLSIVVILGLTWIFGFLAINEAQVALHYIFAILNAFQGLFIFLLFTAREPKIRNAWKKMCCKKSKFKQTSSGVGKDRTTPTISSAGHICNSRNIDAGLLTLVILGLMWIFGFLAINEAQVVFHYIFAILNAVQGLFIFLLFTVREPKIRNAWKKMCCKKSKFKHTSSGNGKDSTTPNISSDVIGSNTTSDRSNDDSPFHFRNPQYHGE